MGSDSRGPASGISSCRVSSNLDCPWPHLSLAERIPKQLSGFGPKTLICINIGPSPCPSPSKSGASEGTSQGLFSLPNEVPCRQSAEDPWWFLSIQARKTSSSPRDLMAADWTSSWNQGIHRKNLPCKTVMVFQSISPCSHSHQAFFWLDYIYKAYRPKIIFLTGNPNCFPQISHWIMSTTSKQNFFNSSFFALCFSFYCFWQKKKNICLNWWGLLIFLPT